MHRLNRRFWFLLLTPRLIRLPRRIWLLLLMPTALVALGTIGYQLIDDRYSFIDALYMTVITLTTIGFGEVHQLDDRGKIFTIALIVTGVFGFAYSATEIVRSVVSGEIAGFLGKQHMERALAQLKDHIIVCGYGRMGHLICKEFARLGKSFVVIERTGDYLKDFDHPHGIALVGDATSDEMLRRAGIDRAQHLVTVMASDADNLFTTMSARLLNPRLLIVARVEDMQSEQKLKRAGANRVVSPYQIGGTRMAHAVLKPTVVDFIDLTTRTEHIELQLEETQIEANSALAGVNLRDTRLRADHQIIIVAIKKASGHMLFNPPPDSVLDVGDILIAMGSLDHLGTLGQLAKAKNSP
ncbi:MAG: potassium channel protein [Planctomycetes bacterium]|nr:potassium channel protein [Planctomycetota bacterium]